MKKTILAIAMLLALAGIYGCQRRPQAGYTAPAGTATPKPQAVMPRSYPPDKTASQDTAGAATKLPEAATAAVTIPSGTLGP
jgi:hypothetical protein